MKALVEECQKLNVNELVRGIKAELIVITLKAQIEALDEEIEITKTDCNYGGKRLWFVCPACKKRIATLYKSPLNNLLRCRDCQNLTYIKRRYHKLK